jgi:hypothetical protein
MIQEKCIVPTPWKLILKQNYNFQLISLTFLFWAPRCCRKFLLKSLWSRALALYCQKHHHTTHTSYFLNVSLTNNISHHQRQFVKSNCWTLDHWMLCSPVAGVTPLLLCSRSPKPVQIFSLWSGTQLSYTHSSHTAYWGMIIHTFGTSGNAVQCCTISAVLWTDHLQTGLYISILQHFVFMTQVEFAYEASRFNCKLWEKHDITVEPVITYIYLCGRSFTSCSSFHFQWSESKISHTELECKTGMKEPLYHWHCIIYRHLFLSPF